MSASGPARSKSLATRHFGILAIAPPNTPHRPVLCALVGVGALSAEGGARRTRAVADLLRRCLLASPHRRPTDSLESCDLSTKIGPLLLRRFSHFLA